MDLIDRQALLEEVRDDIRRGCFDQQTVINTIEYAPAIEPRRGEWITHKSAHGKNYTTCSHCNFGIALKLRDGSIERLDMNDTNYCPICGADMRGESDDSL